MRPSARRAKVGFRLYAEGDIARLLLLKMMKPLGLTLEEMGELADLVDSSQSPTNSLRDVLDLVERISDYASRADAAIEARRQLNEARQLRSRIGDCPAAAKRPSAASRAPMFRWLDNRDIRVSAWYSTLSRSQLEQPA